MLIHQFLENSASRFPDKVAVVHEKTRATYGQINTDADRLAAFLVDRGVRLGDRVAIMLENSVEYVVAYYGILKAGAVAVPLSTDLKPEGLNPLLAELEPAAIITSTRFERLLQASDLNLHRLNTLSSTIPNWIGRQNSKMFSNSIPRSIIHNPQQTPGVALQTWAASSTPPVQRENLKVSCLPTETSWLMCLQFASTST
ncbi:class I adenylate-forming enzyme family protein [Desulfosarcina cetonica]|uniref:AMP-binding protein n=1 Tax=Desulfosarcina cetonica TaxID=90730 RepID=UPI0009F992BC